MTPTIVRGAVRCAVALAVALSAGSTVTEAQQATTTATVRGTVIGENSTPVAGATVVATNPETGVRRGTQTDDQGKYQIPFLEPGTYVLRAQRIGFQAVEKQPQRLAIGQVQTADFNLSTTAVQLAEQRITADAAPLIETQKSGTNTRISEAQLRDLPTNGRNFKDLVVLAPGTSDVGNVGSGGGQSIGGGRTGASNILMDGVNNNESFFGGDARGGDRAPFSYSIEAVKEIQVITAGYDVERGQFTGGTVNAVTKSGTNKFTGALFGNYRGDELGGLTLTKRDYLGRRPLDFNKQQYGFVLGGPIIKDKAHFFFTLDRHQQGEPRPVLTTSATNLADARASGISRAVLDTFLTVAETLYKYNGRAEVGNFLANTDEQAFFGRIDWQISEQHKLTLRDNYTNTNLSADRLFVTSSSTDLLGNAGNNTDKSNSFVGSLNSVLGRFTNELRVQYATEDKPRPANPAGGYGVPVPQVIVQNINSVLSDGSTTRTEIRFGSDPILHANLLEQATTELIDNVRFSIRNHTIKFGVNALKVDVLNRFQNNALGTFTFSSFDNFKNRTPTGYSRTLPFFGATTLPTAEYTVYEYAGYAQDEWQVTPRLFLTYGLRYDIAKYPTKPAANEQLSFLFPTLDVRNQPTDNNNFSPRFGFTLDPNADGMQVIRGGSGVFYGRSPYVLWSNALLNTGRDQLSLNCSNSTALPANVPVPDFSKLSQGNLPSQCLSGGTAAAGAPQINVFAEDYQQSFAWKSNLAYDRMIVPGWRATLEGVYSYVGDNYLLQDANLNATPRFFIEGGRPVYDPTPSTANGSTSINRTRVFNSFAQVFVNTTRGVTKSFQGIAQVNGQPSWGTFYGAYTWDRSRDNGSIPCCTIGTMFGASRPGLTSPNDFDSQYGRSDFSRSHTIVVAPTARLPYGFEVSGIFRTFSGLPWTPRYQFDINGDGSANDRLFVPTGEQLQNPAFLFIGDAANQQRLRLVAERKIRSQKCLRENRGKIVPRNACENTWNKVLDAKLRKRFNTLRGQNFEVQADFFNVLNGLNAKWGRRFDVSGANEALFVPAGFNTTSRRFIYDVNPNFASRSPINNFSTSQFQMQLGMRYNF